MCRFYPDVCVKCQSFTIRFPLWGFRSEVSKPDRRSVWIMSCTGEWMNVLTSCLSRSCCVGCQHLKPEICCSVWRAWFTRSQSRVKRTVRHTQWNIKVNTHRSASHTCVGACWHQKVRLHFTALQSNKSPVKKKSFRCSGIWIWIILCLFFLATLLH